MASKALNGDQALVLNRKRSNKNLPMLLHHESVFNYGQPTQKDRPELEKTQIRATRMTEIYGEPLHEEELYSEFSAQKLEKNKEKREKGL